MTRNDGAADADAFAIARIKEVTGLAGNTDRSREIIANLRAALNIFLQVHSSEYANISAHSLNIGDYSEGWVEIETGEREGNEGQ